MKIDHDALVMVVDGGKMLLFRNEGDGEFPKLQVEEAVEQDNPADREQATDGPTQGRGGSAGLARGAIEKASYHDLNEDIFAKEAVMLLNKRALSSDYEKLIIVAPARTLGTMRKHYHKELESRLVGEIAKDLTSHPVSDIEAVIGQS